jgi:two-component system nitrogen regulation response regulator GlnG
LARHFAARAGAPRAAFAEETMAELRSRSWYGNVRELRHVIEHACVVARAGVVLPEHLPLPQPGLGYAVTRGHSQTTRLPDVAGKRSLQLLRDPAAFGFVYSTFLREAEGPLFANALKEFGNECAPAARALGIHRTTLRRKLVQYGIAESPKTRNRAADEQVPDALDDPHEMDGTVG